ncbi:MAG: uroporphyrinogen-III C-methyltransferase [Edaphobacter sp.]|uniref:uroporphyrinogen-III C-methyltransferase n=1 Tax=Edaphobacter sp. TaxID=1934404 RepID=UPI002390881B|nr:uroporphyrinogen-III C-methyltransferase [Edaphobacter sp.]MDE1175232.1 uroporphyrinogen-III C-methyltransferase [Edaphobacter sp.]
MISIPDAAAGHVYLVGAGPGDPALLTLRAAHLLKTADVILPDDLVSDEILSLASPTANIISVGKRCGQPRITQAGIHELLLEHASAGSSVIRLKSGDPLIFGRAGEEIAFLREHRIPFEIVSGITTAFAVAASLEATLTDRTRASKLILATAHHAAGKVALTPSWSGAFPEEATLVIYMPGRDFEALAADLIASGIAPGTPATAVSRASTSEEQVHVATLETLRSSDVGPAPVILLVGPDVDKDAVRAIAERRANLAAMAD